MSDPLLREPLPVILDREIDSEKDDAFGHRHYAYALEDLIRGHRAPYSIGLLGPWGVGKSSIAQICRKRLANGSDPVEVVTFNAWRYGGQDIKRALFRHVFLELGGNEGELNDRMWSTFSSTISKARPARERYAELWKRWLWFAIQSPFILLPILAPILLFAWWVGWFQPTEGTDQLVVIGIGLTAIMAKAFFSKEGVLVSGFNTFAKIEAPSTNTEQFELALRDQLREFRKKCKATKLLVIFVDDLDRLSAKEMVDGLDGIRAFLEMPCANDAADLGIVFVISCDEECVARALQSRDHQPSAELPGAVFTRMDARRYLDRIFQFRLEIPPAPRRDMHSYATHLLGGLGSEFVASVERTGKSIDDIAAHMIHPGVTSPRNALQIVNTFAQSWWLAVRREADCAGSSRAGALYEGSVTRHPIALAVLSTLRVDFTDFFNDLIAQPSILAHFKEIFLNGTPMNLPPACLAQLQRYAAKDGNEEVPSDVGSWRVHEDFRSLQSYILQTRYVQWPPDLGALLLLSQDPVTRRLGDAGRQIYHGLIQDDERPVLEAFGHQHDKKTLSREDSQMLQGAYEEVRSGETDLYCDNATVVLARLAHRVDVSVRRPITSAVVRRVVHRPELLWRVGVEELEQLLDGAEPDDRKDAIEIVSKALWKREGAIDATTANCDTPTIDEAITMVSNSVELALKTWWSVGLHRVTRNRLIKWLSSRQIMVGNSTTNLPFATLNGWVSEYEDVLCEHVADFYIDQAVSEFENRRLSGELADAVLRRTATLMKTRWGKSQEQNTAQWKVAARLAGVVSEAAVSTAIQQACENTLRAEALQWSEFIAGAVARLARHQSPEFGGVPLRDHLERILKATRTHTETLEPGALKPVLEAAKGWSIEKATFDLALMVQTHLCDWNHEERDVLAREWVQRIASDLPDSGLDLLGRRHEQFAADVQQAVQAEVVKYVSQVALQQDGASRFKLLIDALPNDVARSESWRSTAQAVRVQINAHAKNPNWMQNASPLSVRVLALLPIQDGGAFLTELMNATQTDVNARQRIYMEMGDRWPVTSEGKAHFDTGAILASITKTCEEINDVSNMREVAAAGVRLCERTETPEGVRQDFTKVLLKKWAEDPSEFLELLKRLKTLPALGDLAAAGQMQGADSSESLKAMWQWYIKQIPAESQEVMAGELLKLPSDANASDPEWRLRLWLGCVEEKESRSSHRLLIQLNTDDLLNGDQRLRVGTILFDALTSSDSTNHTSDAEHAERIKCLLATDQDPLIRLMDDARQEIAELSKLSEPKRVSTVKAAFDGFEKAQANEGKAVAARLLTLLHADRETEDFAKGRSLGDIEILSNAMPGNKRLAKLKNKLESESTKS